MIPARKSVSVCGREEPVGSTWSKPPYGYRCDPEDKDHWILDEEAAPVVKLIFDLCIDGKGPEQIAGILEEKQIMTAKARYAKAKEKADAGKTVPLGQPVHCRGFWNGRITQAVPATSRLIPSPTS